ncbi:Der GTPase-activating protein YihI [Colwellia asteriadis]|uniref:Der GTPase-activating protein YihI n=1 Tax=Colwellia asteriadis TaxID=517723 RepID=A0ABN1L4D0_9GAMM
MSRTKKSRKPGGAPTAKPKLSKQELAKVEKRVRKTTGKQAGNRQKEAKIEKDNANQLAAKKDPRLGNKTPIALGKITEKAEKTQQKSHKPKIAQAIAGVRFAEPTKPVFSPEQELEAIEQDEALLAILAKYDEDIALTEQEVEYYNEMMERHQVLTAELGIDDSDDDEDEHVDNDSEDDLWDKLDGHDFSDFEKN